MGGNHRAYGRTSVQVMMNALPAKLSGPMVTRFASSLSKVSPTRQTPCGPALLWRPASGFVPSSLLSLSSCPWHLGLCACACRAVAVELHSSNSPAGPPIKPSHRRLHVHDTADTPCASLSPPRVRPIKVHHPSPCPGCSPLRPSTLPPPAVFPSESYCIHLATPSTPLYNTSASLSHPIPHPSLTPTKLLTPPHTYTIYPITHTRIFAPQHPSRIPPFPAFSESPQTLLSLVVTAQHLIRTSTDPPAFQPTHSN